MLGSRLDNKHPYGVRVATGRGKASQGATQAAKSAAAHADQLLKGIAKPKGKSRPRRRAA